MHMGRYKNYSVQYSQLKIVIRLEPSSFKTECYLEIPALQRLPALSILLAANLCVIDELHNYYLFYFFLENEEQLDWSHPLFYFSYQSVLKCSQPW